MIAQIAAVGHRLQMFGSLRNRNFRWFWLNVASQATAQGMQFLILGWLALELTDSSAQLGLVIFLYGIPNLGFLVFGGIIADRIDRRTLLLVTQTAVTGIVLGLAAMTMTGQVEIWHVYSAAFLLGVLQALNMPARMAMVADLVPRGDIMNAVALNSAVMNTGRIVGPAIAGGIIELAGTGPALYLNAGCYFLAIMFLLLVNGASQRRSASGATIVGDLLVGLRHFRSSPVVFTVIVMGFAFGFFAMPYIQVMPAFARAALGTGAGGAGLLITAAGVGSLLGSLSLASLGNAQYKNWLLLGAIITFCITLFLFAWSPWFWVSWPLLLLVGLGSMSFVSIGTTVLQLTVPPELQGRVLSLWTIGAALHYVGALPMAVVAEAVNWPVAVAGGAALCLVFALWLGVWRPTIRRLRV